MKKIFSTIALVALCLPVFAQNNQNPHCAGLKNPTSFTLTGGTANSAWAGRTGSKNATASTCTASGATFTTNVQAAQLESTNNTDGCSISVESSVRTTSKDIHNNIDHSRQFVIKGSGYDPETHNHLSYLPPDTSYTSSIRLGNYCGNHGAEELTYEFDVTSKNSLVTIWYALSLQNGQHSAADNPEFAITVEKQVNNNWVLAGGDTLCYIRPTPVSGGTQAPFRTGSTGLTTGAGSGVNVYLPWNKVIINLSKLQYQRVRIKITAGDCSMSVHYATCYIAGDCQSMELSANGCAAGETDNVATIEAPVGASAYAWYRSKTGKLNGADILDDSKYELIAGQTDSVLNATISQFINTTTHDTMNQNTFLCKMTTYMNPSLPVISKITVDVGNTKPTLILDSVLGCNGDITLRDVSVTPFHSKDSELVDTTKTRWWFYNSTAPTAQSLLDSATGPSTSFTFPQGGNYCVRVRTSAYDTSCWNEKTVRIRTVKSPVPQVTIERNNLCKGDTILLSDLTRGSGYHNWTTVKIGSSVPDTDFVSATAATRLSFDTTTTVTLRTRSAEYFMEDTTGDGIPERRYCYSDTSFTIHVGEYPTLSIDGDTIVCNGDHSNVHVSSNVDDCQYNWYLVQGSTSPFIENNDNLSTTISEDQTFYVKATSPFGCESWGSVNLYLVKPDLRTTKDRICTGDTVTLTAGKAAYFEWSSNPPDPDLNGQEQNEQIVVSPKETTVYTVVGHGTNGCSATALSQKISVFPWPIQHIQLTPDYIDSENPSVQFTDLSENGSTSLWNFGNGSTSTVRSVVHTFSDLSQDSILISLTTGNPLGCSVDTSFYVPVGIFAVWFPNAFTPSLETNNTFKPFTANELLDYELYIYDRAGVLVFSTKEIEASWDGTYRGIDCNQGNYVYITRYRRKGVERLMTQKGTVTLIR